MRATVVPHDPTWQQAFAREIAAIRAACAGTTLAFHHIGSTAIPGILAKPIIDMLGTVETLEHVDQIVAALALLGYEDMGAFGIEGRRYFRKSDRFGYRSHHLHIFKEGSPHVERHIAFRDYLLAHPDIATQYSALKAKLTRGAAPTWDAYMNGKDPFVQKTEKDAIAWSRKRP